MLVIYTAIPAVWDIRWREVSARRAKGELGRVLEHAYIHVRGGVVGEVPKLKIVVMTVCVGKPLVINTIQ